MMKKVLCLINSMNTGGSETFLMKMMRSIDRSKYQMDFCVTAQDKCFYDDEILSLGGRIHRIPAKSEDLKGFKRALFDVVKKEQYQYVLRLTSNAMGIMDLKIAKNAGAGSCAGC